FEMLDVAIEREVAVFDTAAAYGCAEELLGEFIADRRCKNKIDVISKLRPNLINEDCKNPQAVVEEEIKKSLMKMKIDILDGYLLHTPTDFYSPGIMEGLRYSKEKELVKNIGVSIYKYEHAVDVVKSGLVDYIQVPYSILDQRMDQEEFFGLARKNTVKVYARSAFLQGLILMNENEIPKNLEHVKDYLRVYDEIINEYGLTRIEAAIHFSYDHPGVDYWVFGVDNKKQLLQDIVIATKDKKIDECTKKIKEKLSNIETSIIFPSLWAKK
ncbi:MAG: aldo/keto reductase, partial [Acholeplasma sp.]|nr:aldo/keto reductase [Acholeplasma sp.]